MSPELAERVVDALDSGLTYVDSICIHFYGGEPLTNLPAMQAMVKRTKQMKTGRFSFSVTTNGTCSSKASIALLEAGKFQVILSIDGPAEIHDQCRRTRGGGETHANVMQFLDVLRSQTSCSVRASAVVRSGWSLSQATGYLGRLPVESIKAQAVRGAEGTPFALSPAEKKAYMKDLELIGRQVIAELQAGHMPKDDRFTHRVLQLLRGVSRQYFCGAGFTSFGITPDGLVLRCILMEPEGCVLGHVADDPRIWVRAGRRWRKSRSPRRECKVCSAYYLCGGGCPAMMPICGPDECDFTRKNCEVAAAIFEHFRSKPEALLALAGIT